MEVINVEKIMDEIRKDIQERGYANDMLSFEDVKNSDIGGCCFNRNEYHDIITRLNHCYFVPWYREIGQTGVKAIVKKTIRKIVTFLIAPMSDEQNRFNADVTKAFNQQLGYIEEQDDILKKNRADIQLLEEKIENLQKEMEDLRGKQEKI